MSNYRMFAKKYVCCYSPTQRQIWEKYLSVWIFIVVGNQVRFSDSQLSKSGYQIINDPLIAKMIKIGALRNFELDVL